MEREVAELGAGVTEIGWGTEGAGAERLFRRSHDK